MADGEKKSGSGGGAFWTTDEVEVLVTLLVIALVFQIIYARVRAFISGQSNWGNWFLDTLRYYADLILPLAKLVSLGISALSLVGIFYIVYKITKIREEESAIYHPQSRSKAEVVKNQRWERIVEHINSPNPNDWKLAILEADIILGEMLDSMGYPGLTMGDKLKAVERSDFNTIDAAWEGHKIRNQIAHEGGDFLLNEREARRVVGLYESVFREFEFI